MIEFVVFLCRILKMFDASKKISIIVSKITIRTLRTYLSVKYKAARCLSKHFLLFI